MMSMIKFRKESESMYNDWNQGLVDKMTMLVTMRKWINEMIEGEVDEANRVISLHENGPDGDKYDVE